MNSGRLNEALESYRKTYEQYPDHYYLAHFIQHLEFKLSREYESHEAEINSYAGKYEEMRLYVEENQLFYKDNKGLIFRLLPLSVKVS